MTSLPERDPNPPADAYDEDEVACSVCAAWFDCHEADDEGRCPRCASEVQASGTPGCAAGADPRIRIVRNAEGLDEIEVLP